MAINTSEKLSDVDPDLAKRCARRLRVYSDGSKVHVLHWRSGKQISIPGKLRFIAMAIDGILTRTGNDYSAVVPALAGMHFVDA